MAQSDRPLALAAVNVECHDLLDWLEGVQFAHEGDLLLIAR